MPDRLFGLGLGRMSVARQDPLDFPGRQFQGGHPALRARQQDHSGNFAQGNTRLGILLQGKDVFDDDQVGMFRLHKGGKLGINMVQAAGQILVLGGVYGAEGMACDGGPVSFHNAETGIGQTRINAYHLERRFQGPSSVVFYH